VNLYEFEGKELLKKYGVRTPKSVLVRRGESVEAAYAALGVANVVVKAQVLSGKRGKNNGIIFCATVSEVKKAVDELFQKNIRGQYVAAVLIEEKLTIVEEHYVSIVYNTTTKQPMLLYTEAGGMDIEDVAEARIQRIALDSRKEKTDSTIPYAQALWNCFLAEDTRQIEINPLVKTASGEWFAADAKIALDEDAFYRHDEWKNFEPRTMLGRLPTEREIAVKKIDEGEGYYRGTAGKYIEMDGDVAILFSGGGASIANMDALIKAGLKPANYTEYSGNPPREKVYALAKIVLSKPGLRGLWIAGGVANFTNIGETFHGIADVSDCSAPRWSF
jgi:citryl-CoA synthetase large subunit